MKYSDLGSNYDKYPSVKVPEGVDWCMKDWLAITEELNSAAARHGDRCVLVVECYNGVIDNEVKVALEAGLKYSRFIDSSEAMLSGREITELLQDDITDDEIFGYMTRHNIDCYFDADKVESLGKQISEQSGVTVVYGVGAAHVVQRCDILVYADMARWEIQMRFRHGKACNVGLRNFDACFSYKYKRGFFVDWRILDRFKKKLMPRWDYVLDTNKHSLPKMTTGKAVRETLADIVGRPFRVVPFFDPGPWGGQWMKEVCDLSRETINFAWCFDCVPEENSLLLRFSDADFEIPSIDLVFAQPRKLLGEPVHGRFGDEFPIRFDFLDTMGGGNLSLQVHPLTEYIQEKFGMHYTQDESYYILDVGDDGAVVYLGLKEDVDPEAMERELREAQHTGKFNAEKHVGIYPIKKHDHVLIPAGTVHCSGLNSMVLEISATPFIFTFKMWDWGRNGLDGKPRPINIEHGMNNIQWDRTEKWVEENLLNQTRQVASGEGWREEHTGLHESEFIETRRFWFTGTTRHNTGGGVNVINLVEGCEAIVESPSGAFEPFTVHYAETFIVPAAVGEYTVRPYGASEGRECAIIKAFVKFNALQR